MSYCEAVDTRPYETPFRAECPLLQGSGVPGAFDEGFVDIPFVFFHGEQYYMMYTGFDHKGYQTALAVSDDLLHWQHLAVILQAGDGEGWNAKSVGGTWMLKESCELRAVPRLKKVDGRYWLVYHAYPQCGFEEGPACIGLAWCEDETLLDWHKLDTPILRPQDGAPWEQGGLYKGCLFAWENRYYLFYNAKDTKEEWTEQTGFAVSNDLLHWQRCPANPVLCVSPGSWDSRFASDPFICRDGGRWLNFYFGFDGNHAQEGLAISDDLLHWQKASAPLLAHGEAGACDEKHAHKAALVEKDGVLYHFYGCVREAMPGDKAIVYGEARGITVAASRPIFTSARKK